MSRYWTAHSDRDWQDDCGMYDNPEPEENETMTKFEVSYKARFVRQGQLADLVNLYHLARAVLFGKDDSRWARKCWAAKEFHKEHPEISSTAAYKDLDGALS